MNSALSKLKAKLTSRFTHDELGIEASSETVLASYNEYQVGGLRYRASATTKTSKPIHVEIMHDQLDQFDIYVYTCETGGTLNTPATRIAAPVKFSTIDSELQRLVERVRVEG